MEIYKPVFKFGKWRVYDSEIDRYFIVDPNTEFEAVKRCNELNGK